jgi:hypothetical protein
VESAFELCKFVLVIVCIYVIILYNCDYICIIQFLLYREPAGVGV